MQRREFITLIGGAAVAWPLAVLAQQGERMRRIALLTGITGEDAQTKARVAAFLQELQRLGWTEGRNLRIHSRAGAGNLVTMRKYAAELVALAPDVILASGAATVAALLEATHTVPIVFTIVVDPVGAGFVEKLSRPAGNATGFMLFEYSLSGKWVELLKQVAPSVTQAAVLRDPAITAGVGQFAATKRKAEANAGNYEPTLAAATKNLGDRVEIRIRDNGTGIPPEAKAKMFNPFFTTKPVGQGTGLGLSISHDIIVKQHGGSIEVDAQPGEFTEFRIVLPRAALGQQ